MREQILESIIELKNKKTNSNTSIENFLNLFQSSDEFLKTLQESIPNWTDASTIDELYENIIKLLNIFTFQITNRANLIDYTPIF